jgi:hypothetical protein
LWAVRSRALLTVAAIALPLIGGQTKDTETAEQRGKIKATIDNVFDRNLAAGTITLAPGIYAYSRVPLSDADLQEIAAYGSNAIPALSEYFASARPRVQELTVRSIAYIGGAEAIQPLQKAAMSSDYQTVRLQAVLSLGSFSGTEVDQALKEVARASRDDRIRAKAMEILSQRRASPPVTQ